MKIYENLIGTAVHIKRIAKGMGKQTDFTEYLESIEYKTKDELHMLQAEEMSRLLKHTVENIPYYAKFKGEFKLEPSTVYEDINEFPVITKDIINADYDSFVNKNGHAGKKYKTGGTSGKTTHIIRDKNEVIHSANEYFNRIAGVYPGICRLLIRRAESVYFSSNPHDVSYESNPLTRTYIVSPAYMDQERLELLYSVYSHKKPKIIMGITDPVYRFAKYIIEYNLKSYPVESILLGGQTMLPKYRETIEKAFGTKNLYDRYGATEFGILGHQCDHFEGLHYIPLIHYIEVVDNDFNEVETGKPGQFIVTNLWKREMPLIRYQIDDFAVLTDKECSCGRGFPMIKCFEGRRIESVVSPKHTYMTPLPFFEIMSEFTNVDDFLIEQHAENSVTFKLLMKHGEFSLVQQLALRKEINRYLDYPMKLQIEYIDEIIPLPNGKIMRVMGLENYNKK